MIEVKRADLTTTLDRADLFQEFWELKDASRYKTELLKARAWRLEAGEALPAGHGAAAYATLPDSALIDPNAPLAAEGKEDENPPPPTRRVFGQWTGLRGQPLAEPVPMEEAGVVIELTPELLRLLLDVTTFFKIAFYAPLVQSLEPLSDTPPGSLGTVILKSRFGVYKSGEKLVRRGELGRTMYFVLAGKALVEIPARPEVTPGNFFGEVAVLSHQDRTADVSAAEESLIMESGRDSVTLILLKKSKKFKALVEERAKQFMVLAQLRANPFFEGLSQDELEKIRDLAQLETFDSYEPLFFQGDPADSLYLIVNGTVTVVEETDRGTVPLAWVRSGQTLGEMGLFPEITGSNRRNQTVTAVQHVDAIRFPAQEFLELAERLPGIKQKLTQTAQQRAEANRQRENDKERARRLGWIMETQHIQGQAVLAVDMNDCIRCNNCVTACQSTHADGLNRFFWDNLRQDETVMPHVRLSHSCQHCEYPLCTTNCPTNAIDRNPVSGAVVIDYGLCIKCGKCADPNTGCPYGSIAVEPVDKVNPLTSVPFFQWLSGLFNKNQAAAPPSKGKKYPVKCDLCPDLPYEACAEHCPTGAVFRIDGDRQFQLVVDKGAEAGRELGSEANRPTTDTIDLYVEPHWEAPTLAGPRPVELKVVVRTSGRGTPIRVRRPEQGVTDIELNFYLHAPDMRLGGGSLRQLRLPVDTLAPRDGDNPKYSIGSRTPMSLNLPLLVFQGGQYLGRSAVQAEFVKG